MNIKFLLSTVLTSLVLAGCGSSDSDSSSDACSDSNNDDFNCAAMLNDVVESVVQPTMNSLVVNLEEVETSFTTYCADINNTVKKDAAKADWLDAVADTQQLLVMQFGPFADDELTQIYSWPSFGEALFDAEIVNYNNAADNFTISSGSSRKGLIALEYILYTDNGYMAPTTDDTSASVVQWKEGKTAEQIQQARCDYALLAIDDLNAKALSYQTQWNAYDLAGDHANLQSAANAISDALFYVDKQTKDAKLKAALPQDSEGVFNAAVLESQFAYVSKAHLKNNLLGAKALLSGNSGLGIGDYLGAKGQSDLTTQMMTSLDGAIANLDAISGDLNSAVTAASDSSACINATSFQASDSDIIKLCALQVSIKAFTDLLKEDFILTLNFSKPAEADGDND